ncbi:MAG TPA: phosphonate C-P lyase system protein PhnH [Spirochaetia bacterium]|nr:phosphonate C-P lyase system protein PhnH [Spirochaetia bacterium]
MVRETAFDDIFDSQATFRVLLDCLSKPGTVGMVRPLAYESPPQGFCSPALSIMKTLCDHRVSFSVGSAEARSGWTAYLEMNLSTPLRPVPEADYVVFDGRVYDDDFSHLNRGTLEFPESSATALLCVQELFDTGEPSGFELRLRGPGVNGQAQLFVTGLDARYLRERIQANRFYPMGIDVFLVDASGRLAGIPRTSVVEV